MSYGARRAVGAEAGAVHRPVTVLIVQAHYWNCGPAQSMLQHLRHLDRTRFRAVLACPAPGEFLEQFRPHLARLVFVRGVRTPPRSLNPLTLSRYLLEAMWAVVKLALLIRRERVDLVHNNAESSLVAGLAARLCRVPAVTHCRGLALVRPEWLGRVLVPLIIALYDVVIVVSRAVREALAAFSRGADPFVIIYNGVDTERFRPLAEARTTLADELRKDPQGPWIGTVGGVDPRKGQEYFIRAAALVRAGWPAASFFVVGPLTAPGTRPEQSDYLGRLRQLVAELGLSHAVLFTGERQDICLWLNAFDLVVQPSLTDAGPRVPLEAMACGRAVVATRVEGNAEEVVHGVTGLLVEPANDAVLAEAVLRLLADEGLRTALGEGGRRRVVEHFAIEARVREIERLYDDLLRRQGRGCPAKQRRVDQPD